MIGRAISHYRVLGTLGSGGMGVVYLAEDERLGRQVALKFLPAESVASRQALERFRVEARAASALSHPGICAIFDIGENEGTPYIVMEALKGESLRDRINRGPLKVADLLDIAIQLADALDAAHAQGIIHRDIKPSNIFIGEKNRTKILDFGLAKLTQTSSSLSSGAATRALDASTHRDLTIPGSTLGTVSYMSPEQARGEDVDTRTDLFSLGVVLYEMATGIQAFGGSTQAVVFDAILNRTPQAIAHVNPLVPPRLEALIATALEKDRDLRHQHASDLEAELKRIRRDLESGSLVSAASRTAVVPSAERNSSMTASSTPSRPGRLTWWIGTATTALVIVGLAGIGLYRWLDTPSQVAMSAPQTAAAAGGIAPPPAPAAPEPESAPPVNTLAPATAAATQRPTAPPSARAPEPRPQTPSPAVARPPVVTPPAQPPAATPPPPRPLAEPSPSSVSPPAPQTTAVPPQAAEPAPSKPTPTTAAPGPAGPSQSPPATQPPPSVQPDEPTAAQPLRNGPAPPPPARGTAAAPSPQPSIPPTSPVESDDALIRGVIRTYERAIETKNVELFRSIWPGLSPAEESRLRTSFNQIDSQQVDITVGNLRITGRTATVQISRRDTIVSGGRRQTASSRQTLSLEKAGAGWIIAEIVGR